MKLGEYLKTAGVSQDEFARRVGVSVHTIRAYIFGKRIPNRTIMPKIIIESDGAVMADDFYD